MSLVSIQDTLEWVKKGECLLVDVREAHEFSEEHIPYALSIPLSVLSDSIHLLSECSYEKIVIHCLKGGRGGRTCDMLQKMDFPHNVYNMEGGITAWRDAGFPTILGTSEGD